MLTLCFHGSVDLGHNVDTDWLYVVVENSLGRDAVVYHPDPQALLSSAWQKWTIDFDRFGSVDLSHVARLILGIGNRDNPRPGGNSVAYVDAIGLDVGATE